MDEYGGNGPGTGTPELDRAPSRAGSLARMEVRRHLYREAALRKAGGFLLWAALLFSGFLICFMLLYGASDYMQGEIRDMWRGSMSEAYTDYDDQAEFLLDALRNGSLDLGNDMPILSNADAERILQHVIEYNADLAYSTKPPVRYSYYVPEPRNGGDGSISATWRDTVKWNLKTLSYAVFGQEADGLGRNRFEVPWQTIFVLCEMMSEANFRNYGSDADGWRSANMEQFRGDYSFETSMDGYYLTDEQIDSICYLVDFQYAFYVPDYVERTKNKVRAEGLSEEAEYGLDLDVAYMESEAAYELAGPFTETDAAAGSSGPYYVRVPALAPKSISNFYELVEYEYEEDAAAGDLVCAGRKVTVDADRFMAALYGAVPEFSFAHFLELLKMLPGSEGLVATYGHLYELHEGNGAHVEIVEDYGAADVFPGKGVHVPNNAMSDIGLDFTGAGSVWISQTTDGAHVYDSWFAVSDGAYARLDRSDGLSAEEIKSMLGSMAFLYRLASGDSAKSTYAERQEVLGYLCSDEMAQALYCWQEEKGCSVSGAFAITLIEGEWDPVKGDAYRNYNPFNIMADGTPVDYKKMFGASRQGFIDAVIKQVSMIADRYWLEDENRQNCYFYMQFSASYGGEAGPGTDHPETLVHCYCPWYEDAGFPASGSASAKGFFPALAGKGWCNSAADFRETLLRYVGKTANIRMRWPCAGYTRLSSPFGSREAPTEGASAYHEGIDLAAPEGTEITAAMDGTVKQAGYSETAGYYLVIGHDGGLVTKYFHMLKPTDMEAGDAVRGGQVVGYVGDTGVSTGSHLHFQVEAYGVPVDPLRYVVEP